MTAVVDLHLHSTASDGVLEPEQLAACVHAAGVRGCALTDHDTVAGLERMATAAQPLGLATISGIELSAAWMGRDVHIVGLGFDPAHPAMQAAIATRQALRRARLEEIAARLERQAVPGRSAVALLADVTSPTRTHLARALVELGACKDLADAFRHWLAQGRPGYVPTPWPEPAQTVAEITAAGGCAVLAHPLRYRFSAGQRRTLARLFAAAGGTALEVVGGGMAAHQIETTTGLALRSGLEGSIGSDCHDPALPWHRPGRLATLPAAVTPVWHRWPTLTSRAPEP